MVDSVYAFTALALGDDERVKKVISDFAQSRNQTPSAKSWRLLDETSAAQLRFLSDRYWTKDRGHRNQLELGRFWTPEPEEENNDEEDSLLEGLDEE